MYQIIRITDLNGTVKSSAEDKERLGAIGEAKMEGGCVLMHCRYDRRGNPCDKYIRTSYVKKWDKDPRTGRIVVKTMNSFYHLDPVKVSL